MAAEIRCILHGLQTRTYVCQHIAAGMASGRRVGFFWTHDDPDDPRPDAWCGDCEARVKTTGGEWIGEALEQLQPTVLCSSCYDRAKSFHLGTSN